MNSQFRYVPKAERTTKPNQNKASGYASAMMKSQYNQFGDSNIISDYESILNNGCFYLPNFFCESGNTDIFEKIKNEIKQEIPVGWSKHQKYENPQFSKTFNEIVEKMAKHFNVKVIQTRLNYYHDGSYWKPFHHDSHAYGIKDENFTMGASFGDSRELIFLHPATDNKFTFPQNNGDIFAFNKEVNQKFMHGIPKAPNKFGERFSIIAWGEKIEK